LADSGEDAIAVCQRCDYAANTELARSHPTMPREEPPRTAQEQITPGIRTVMEQAQMLSLPLDRIIKSIVVIADGQPAVLFLAGDDELNLIKARSALNACEVRLAEPEEAQAATGVPRGFIGPKGLPEGLVLR